MKRLEPVKAKHKDVSWADLIAYVGVVAIEEMGGPKVPFAYGRVDQMDPSTVTPDGRLPAADAGDGGVLSPPPFSPHLLVSIQHAHTYIHFI